MIKLSSLDVLLLYSPGIGFSLEDLAKGADRVFYFEEGQDVTTGLTANVAENEGSADFRGLPMISV